MAEMVAGIQGMRQLEIKLDRLAKKYAMHNAEIRKINETAAGLFARAMKREIISYDRDIVVTNSEGKPRITVKKGTYKRSIGAWLINENGNAYWAGPRTGRKVGRTRDAWFAYIVESDQQLIRGFSQNAGAIERVIKSRTKGIEKWRVRQLRAYQNKVNAELQRTK